MTASMQDRIQKNIQTYKFDAESRGFTFETYVNKHVDQHNLHNGLTEHGVDPLSEQLKILYFRDGIKDPRFAAVTSAILVDRDRFQTFDSVSTCPTPVPSLRRMMLPLPGTGAACLQ
jgi:hypothetical protein